MPNTSFNCECHGFGQHVSHEGAKANKRDRKSATTDQHFSANTSQCVLSFAKAWKQPLGRNRKQDILNFCASIQLRRK
eukprot:1118274-Amphidinium_carterae.1